MSRGSARNLFIDDQEDLEDQPGRFIRSKLEVTRVCRANDARGTRVFLVVKWLIVKRKN